MIKRFASLLRRIIGRIKQMPLFKRPIWQGYTIYAHPTDKDFWRKIDLFRLLPYFWDSPICFDLSIQPPKNKRGKNDETWHYEWELCNLDDVRLKNGEGDIELTGMNP